MIDRKEKNKMNTLFPRGEEVDISSELYRIYKFPGGNKVKINSPSTLVVSDNGHRIVDSAGNSHYIPTGWIHLFFKVKEGEKPWFYQRDRDDRKEKELLVENK